ncbi:MAG: hypothetical protein AAB373_02300 [Patescibacteria group bacterium]
MKKNKVLLISAIVLVLGAILLAALSMDGSLFQGKLNRLNTCDTNSGFCLGVKNLKKETQKVIKAKDYPDPTWYPNSDFQPTK